MSFAETFFWRVEVLNTAGIDSAAFSGAVGLYDMLALGMNITAERS